MSTLQTSYIIYLVCFSNMKTGHHTIYIDIEKDARGHKFHVVGSLQQGMAFETMETRHPFFDPVWEWMKPVGRVSQEKFAKFEEAYRAVPALAKQYDLVKLLVPKDQIRHCQHWAAEAIEALQHDRILEPLGPADRGDVIYRE